MDNCALETIVWRSVKQIIAVSSVCPIAKATFIDLGYITNACSPSALEIKTTCFRKQVTKVKVKSAHHHFSQPCHDAFDGRLPSNRAITGGNVSMLIMFRLACKQAHLTICENLQGGRSWNHLKLVVASLGGRSVALNYC